MFKLNFVQAVGNALIKLLKVMHIYCAVKESERIILFPYRHVKKQPIMLAVRASKENIPALEQHLFLTKISLIPFLKIKKNIET